MANRVARGASSGSRQRRLSVDALPFPDDAKFEGENAAPPPTTKSASATWNERVGPPGQERLLVKKEFLSVLHTECPDAFTTLRSEVLPLWRNAFNELLRQGWSDPRAAALRVGSYTDAPVSHLGACLDFIARQALERWVKRYRIEAEWVWDWARTTLASWVFDSDTPASTTPTKGFVSPNLVHPLEVSASQPIPPWFPEGERLTDFRERIEEHIRCKQQWAREHGLLPAKERRDRGGRTLIDRLT